MTTGSTRSVSMPWPVLLPSTAMSLWWLPIRSSAGPARRSAQSLTSSPKPIAEKSRNLPGSNNVWAVNGPPALCIMFARMGAFPVQPDLIVSGINPGANVGRSVYHSGTVGACLTGRNGGVPVSRSVRPCRNGPLPVKHGTRRSPPSTGQRRPRSLPRPQRRCSLRRCQRPAF